MHRDEIIRWLCEDDERRLEELWRRADDVRRESVGDDVHLRGLIEFSNVCRRHCAYCGLRADNTGLARYRMTVDEILASAHKAHGLGYGTVVLQSGEDPKLDVQWMSDLIRRIKTETPLAVTLSLGERTDGELALWKEGGADRYLLRFETSSREVFERIHPPAGDRRRDRIEILRTLEKLGYETGGGVMIGIPGTTYEDLANDILLFRELDLDMIGVGPCIPHPATPLGKSFEELKAPADEQVPNTELMCYNVVALTRIIQPPANIPSTTALATVNLAEGYELGLQRGANVVMPNVTPVKYRGLYEIYPSKAGTHETDERHYAGIRRRIHAIGRKVGTGRGDSPNYTASAATGHAQQGG